MNAWYVYFPFIFIVLAFTFKYSHKSIPPHLLETISDGNTKKKRAENPLSEYSGKGKKYPFFVIELGWMGICLDNFRI